MLSASIDFHKEYLDLVLVPCGLLIMFVYHLFLFYRYHKHPGTTIIGLENKDKKLWVQRVLQGAESDVDRAVNVISSDTSIATYLASVSLTLSSRIGTWLGSSSSNNIFESKRIYGDTRPFSIFMKNICLLVAFLIAFSCFVQAAKNLVHVNYLMSSPDKKRTGKKIEFAVTKGGDFSFFGLRALYFALNMLLWFFGPIPMFVASIVMVIVLYYHDIHTVSLHNLYCELDGQKGKTQGAGGSFSY
ncbi:unnamed protein product [Dovyalis caffra]|uniref:DUF599 domain-containing protein n=1 Tax=Dovyalis caffra TaxID=77055 RepID=A0AAV1SJC6_9ROSI|nr:unnamed protein product [Dovyalis caffra]